jgi:hypothetical protein
MLIKSFDMVDHILLAVSSDGLQLIDLGGPGKSEASPKPAVFPGEPLLKEAGKPLAVVQVGEELLCCFSGDGFPSWILHHAEGNSIRIRLFLTSGRRS